MIKIDGLTETGTMYVRENQTCILCKNPGVELVIRESDTFKYFHIRCAEKYVEAAHAPAPVEHPPTATSTPLSAPDASDGRKLDDSGGVG